MVRDILNRLTGSSSSSGQSQQNTNQNRPITSTNTSREDRYQQYQGYAPPTVTWSVSNTPTPAPARPAAPAPRPVHGHSFGFVEGYGYGNDYDRTRNRIPVVRSPSHITLPVPIPNHRLPGRGASYPPPLDAYSYDPNTSIMSRASSRPTHIAMPNGNSAITGNGNGRSPNGSPLPTPQGATSPTSPRSSFLPSFIRTRSRAATLTGRGRSSPTTEASNPLGGTTNRPTISRNPSNTGEASHVTRSISTPQGMAQQGTGHRHEHTESARSTISAVSDTVKAAINAAQPPRDSANPITTYRIRLVPHLESTRSLAFDPVTRELLPIVVPSGMGPGTVANNLEMVPNALNGRPPALILKVGRFTEKATTTAPTTAASTSTSAAHGNGAGPSDAIGQGPMSAVLGNSGGGGDICSSRVAFKSKVVSRSHAEIWCEPNGKVSPSRLV